MKPLILESNMKKENLINDFMNLENEKTKKLKGIIKACNEINSPEFNEVLLFFFEGQCQSYFLYILNKYKNNYSTKCCEEMLLDFSLLYFKKAIQYLDNYNNKNNNNNLLKTYAIAFIKTYCHFYVEINYNYFDKCNFYEINEALIYKDAKNKSVLNMIHLYIRKLYYKKFGNFEQFKNFDFNRKQIPFYNELKEKICFEERNPNNISKEKSYKEIIMENNDPLFYNQNIFPDIQYYTISCINNLDIFYKKFKSCEHNKTKYILINTLLDEKYINNIKYLNCLNSINNLTTLLLKKYSFKISREESKKIIFKNELQEITNFHNKIYDKKFTLDEFKNSYIKPFFESWNKINNISVQYKARILIDLEKCEKPINIDENFSLYYFLIDNGEWRGGMFLSSIYEHMIDYQNQFLNLIIDNNKINGTLNEYVSQLEKDVNIQDATSDEILNVDNNTFEHFKNLILSSSMRNIFQKDNNIINYKNYNDIIYDYDFIEKELAKIILTGKKRFSVNINFITYIYEGFRGINSCLLSSYNEKYKKRTLNEYEEKLLFNLINENKNNKFYIDIYSSLQILMNSINKENYNPQMSLYKIIINLPPYIIINEELKNFLTKNKEPYANENLFTINCLVSIFEIFEGLCWGEIKKNILEDYKITISEESKIKILNDFKNNNRKIINKNNFTSALRKFISRYLSGARQEIDIKSDTDLFLYLIKSDLWNVKIDDEDNLIDDMYSLKTVEIIVGQTYDLYNILEGDKILNENINEKIFGKSIDKDALEEKIEENFNINESNEEPENSEEDYEDDFRGEL